MENFKKNKKAIIIGSLIFIAFVASLIIMRIRSQVSLYKDTHTVGNTSGNLLNGGLFAESDGKIYFANPKDNGTLYVMGQDLKDPKQLYNDNVSYLNVAGDYLFYTRRNDKRHSQGDAMLSLSKTGLFRLNISGTRLGKLYDAPTQTVSLYGNYLYYQRYDKKEGLQLGKAKIDGDSDEVIVKEGIAPYSIQDDKIIYAALNNDHMIHSMRIDGSEQSIIFDGNATNVIRVGQHIYFMDMDQNYALCRVKLDGSEPEVLESRRVATYNVDGSEQMIYYQVDDGKENGLYGMNLDSQITEKVQDGDYNFIHLTKDYLFCESFDQNEVYVMKIGGAGLKNLKLPDGK